MTTRALFLGLMFSLTGCSVLPHGLKHGLKDELPLCPDAMAFAERDLHTNNGFDAGKVVYRQEDGVLCRGI